MSTAPVSIHLERIRDADWRDRDAVVRQVQGFRQFGFRVIGTFRLHGNEERQFVALGQPEEGLGAVVHEDENGVYSEVLARYREGGVVIASNGPDDGSTAPGRERVVLKRRATAKKLCHALWKNVVSEDFLPVHPRNFVAFYQVFLSEEVAWRLDESLSEESIPRDPELDTLCAPLFKRIAAHDVPGVQAFLDQGIAPEGRNRRRRTPLMAAATTGVPDLVQAILDAGADPNGRAPGSPGVPSTGALTGEALVTALTLAIETGVSATVSALLVAGVNLEGPADPPLHFAAEQGDVEMVRTLAEAGAEIDMLDDEGRTPIHIAAREGHHEIARYLAEAGANVEARHERRPAVIVAAEHGASEVVEVLAPFSKARFVRKAEKILTTADLIGDVTLSRLMNAAMNGRAPMIRKLLATPLHPDSRESSDQGDVTPLMAATQGGHVEVMRVLIEAGADVDHHDGAERVISRALRTHFMEDEEQQAAAVRLLVDSGADISHLGMDEQALIGRLLGE